MISLPLYIDSACTYDDTAGRISFFYSRTLASCLNTSVRELQLKCCDFVVVAAAALPLTTAAAWPLTSRIEHCIAIMSSPAAGLLVVGAVSFSMHSGATACYSMLGGSGAIYSMLYI